MSTPRGEYLDAGTHEQICSQLFIEYDVKKSWESFQDTNDNYTLDGNPLHWLACAVYVGSQDVGSGSCSKSPKPLDFTKFLRLYKISVVQFFDKMKKWMDMNTVSDQFRLKIEKLERKVAVSILLFQKFNPIFHEIFADGNEISKRSQRKPKSISFNNLFEMTWCLFICVKSGYKDTGDNLVDMFHILLSCLDYVFENVFQAQKLHLLNLKFKGVPPNCGSPEYEFPPKAPCIIQVLSEMYECSTLEAASSKQYGWKPIIDSFFDKKILKGDEKTLTGIFDLSVQDYNMKKLNSFYESSALKLGDFDERLFLDAKASDYIGTSNNPTKEEFTKSINSFGVKAQDTPLTGRGYLKRAEPLTPISAATNNIARLRNYLSGCEPQPSQRLIECLRDPQDIGIEYILNRLMVTECKSWMQQISSLFQGTPNGVNSRITVVATLHYKVLEEILFMEKQKKPYVSLLRLLERPELQRSVFACCAEICVRAFGSAGKFPKVLQLLNLPAFNFYKVIELVVLVLMDKMTRDIIKHLNVIEEQILESLVWTSDSPIWARLESGEAVPSSCEVVENSQRRPESDVQSLLSNLPERVQLAVDQCKKQLFQDNAIKPGQSLLVKEKNNTSPPSPLKTRKDDSTPTTPRKNGSLGLFFRKFYSLAVARVSDLCQRLNFPDESLKTKVWTCLEHSLMHYTHLLRDRHLDQLIMCTVYVICKVSSSPSNPVECTFTEIMRCYRLQPQADNHVYRSVLISANERGDLIRFYNTVYVQCMQSFALKFTGKHKDECPLSPLPAGRGAQSPSGARRVSAHHRLFVRPLPPSPPPPRHLAYCVSRSPAQDLRAINTMLSAAASPKRSAEESPVVKRACTQPGVARKLQGLLMDRQTV